MRRWVFLSVAAVAVGCSWARFDDLEENASVLVLKQPSGIPGFGSALAAAADGNRVLVLVSGSPKGANGAAVFELGQGQDANLDAFDIGQCNTNDCVLASSIAALPLAESPSGLAKSACWVTGFQKKPGADPGLGVACTETGMQRFVYTLALPVTANADVDELILAGESLPPVGAPPVATALIAGLPKITGTGAGTGTAVAYAPASITPIALVPVSPQPVSFGAAVAVVRQGNMRRFVVGAPEVGQLFVFDETGMELGCISGPPRFARTLAPGDVDGDGADDLVVAAESEVMVVRGSALASLNQPGSCSELSQGDTMVTLRCRASSDVDGCSGGFGDALAVGDIDGNGDGEVAVGAPSMNVRDAGGAGAVFIYDVDLSSKNPQFVTEERFISSAESGDRLGSAVTFAPQKGRHILVAGAPAAGKTAIFYCSRLLPSNKRGKRCE